MKSSVYLRIQAYKSEGEDKQEGPRSARLTGIMSHNTSLKRFPSDYSS